MKLKKITSIICGAAMALSIISMPAAANTATTEKYLLINDQFGEGDIGGWVQHKHSDSDYGSLTTTDIGGGNYALLYETGSSNWGKDFITRDMPGGKIVFNTGVDVVVETKIKQSVASGRVFFKYNLAENVVSTYNTQEWNFQWGMLFINNNGKIQVNTGWNGVASTKEPGTTIYSYPIPSSQGFNLNSNHSFADNGLDKWYTWKIKMHGKTGGVGNKISLEMYDENGSLVKSITEASMDFPDNSEWAQNASSDIQVRDINWVEDVLNNLAFRTRNATKLEIDYFKVWQEGIKVTAAEANADMRTINLRFASNGAVAGAVADYIKLYEEDGVTEVTGLTKAFDAATKTLTFTSETDLPAGNIYKIKVDKAALNTDVKITWEAAEEFSAEAPACAAIDLKIKGELAPGTELEADYDLMPEGSVEGASVFTWYTVDENGEKTAIGGQTGKTFTVTTDYVDSTITYSVTPKCVVDGVEKTGIETNCTEAVKPLSKPVASNPGFDKASAMIDSTLTAIYDYSDADIEANPEDNEENGSVISWYTGDSADFEISGEPFATGETVEITEELNGKYIKYTVTPKNNAAFRNEGDTVTSSAIGPVADMITASNMLTNAGLENGELAPWTFPAGTNYKGISLVDDPENVYEGNYAMRVHSRTKVGDAFKQAVSLPKGKMYIVSAMAKSATGETVTGWEGYVSGSSARPFRAEQYTTVSPDEWTRVSLTFTPGDEGVNGVGLITWASDYGSSEVYADNFYLGELMISDVGTAEIVPVTVPKGEETVKVNILKLNADDKPYIYNQFGETDGLTNQIATVSIPEGTKGVKVVNNQLIIDSNAVAGKIDVSITVVPDFTYSETKDGNTITYNPTPAQSEFVKTVEVELLAHNDKTPVVKSIDATGTVYTGATLTGSYDFYQVDGDADLSEIQWMYAENPEASDAEYQPIPGATSLSYTVTSAYADKFIKFAVTPKTANGEGVTAYSSMLAQATAPVAENIKITGDIKVGGELTAGYDFYDVNKDSEGTSKYQWYVLNESTGEFDKISGETSEKLSLTADLTGKKIKFGVIPVSATAPYTGEEAFSEVITGPVAPEARDVSVKVEGDKLTGVYTYYHEHNARELKSIYSWKIDGNEVSKEASYVADFSGVKTVTFTVTPVGDTNPGTGKSVTVSVTINGKQGTTTGGNTPVGGIVGGGSGGGGSSSSGGGGAIAGGVTSINDKNYVDETTTKPAGDEKESEGSDLDGHWGESYIKKMEERGIMGADENGNYNPDELVNREDMLTFLFKALKLEKSEYSGMFSDVADGEFAGMLQTMVDNGTISKDTAFRPNDNISREEMCKILYISLKNADKLVEEVGNPAEAFEDYADISEWALPYVNAIYSIEIMIGVSADRFAPQENVTKAQAATMLTRLISFTEGE